MLSFLKCVLVLTILRCNTVICFYDSQPKIVTSNGNLIIESAEDRNITFRLNGNGRISINEHDLLNIINNKNSPLPSNIDYSTDRTITNSPIINLLSDLQRNVSRLNISVSTVPQRFRRITQRIQSVNRRLNEISRKLQTDKCNTIPCKNGGYCIPIYDGFKCQCSDNWEGSTCETDVDECSKFKGSDLGCQNGAWCANTPGGYNCQCANGFSGTHCTQRKVDCLKGPPGELCGHGVCVPSQSSDGYQCICEQGWTTNGITPACTYDVDECETSKNRCHSTCTNLPGSFRCEPCPQGYTGNGLVCKDINECETNNGGCSLTPKVNCINTEGSSHCGSCPPGWSGDGIQCSRMYSTSCPSNNPCYDSSLCLMISGETTCTCPAGMHGHGYGRNGCTQKTTNLCDPNPCLNGGTCRINGTSYSCSCLTGFNEASNCRSDNACNSNPCLNGATCRNIDSSYRCICPRGMTGRRCSIMTNRCGGLIDVESGNLKIINYPVNQRCAWQIKTNETKILNVTFDKFNLEKRENCAQDFLQIHDGRTTAFPLIGRFCGNKLPKDGQIYTTHNTIYMWFRSDVANTTGKGFELHWTSIDPICGGTFNVDNAMPNGVIKSPGYPGNSPSNRDCSWDFVGPYGKTFEFRFFEVKLGSTAAECDDYIEILDSGELLEKICESGLPQPKKTTSNKISINFHTNSVGSDSAFQLHYEISEGQTDCGGYFNNTEGIIKSPTGDFKGTPSATCWYLIKQPEGTHVRLEFTKYEMASFLNCSLQSLEIYDGERDSDKLFGTFCGDVRPDNLTSTNNYLLIKYKYVDNSIHTLYSGFSATYKLSCDETFRNTSGIIKSPGYPNPYYKDLNCVYTFYAPVHNKIFLFMDSFSLSKEDECNMATDNLEVYDDDKLERYCHAFPSTILSKSTFLVLKFHSFSNSDNAIGFNGRYNFTELYCGGVLHDMNGTITTDDLPASAVFQSFCEWVLIAPPEHSISLTFTYFDLGQNNCSNYLEVFVNISKKRNQIGKKACGQIAPLSATYASDAVTLHLAQSGRRKPYGFIASYQFIDTRKNCGGNFTSLYGSFQSPNYPKEYINEDDCVWIIHAPIGHQIELVIRDFSLENTTSHCSEDYLEIRNGMTAESPLIGRFCGENVPERIPSFTNHLYIYFHSDWSITKKGFKIDWEQTATGCGGIINSYEGSIHSPHYPDIMNDVAQCDWYISVSAGSIITFKILPNIEMNICESNKLLIYDGPNSWYKQMKFNCSQNIQEVTGTSSGNTLFVRFLTSVEDNNKFLLEYQTNCDVNLHDMHGVIESPNFPNNYPNDLECNWRITSKKAKHIKLIFSHLELEGQYMQCPYDTLTIAHILNNEEIFNDVLCKDKPYLLNSRGPEILIKFKTDFSNGAKGFRMEYQIEGCGEHLFDNLGKFGSPNYPYSLNVYCMWTIEAEFGYSIQLNITNFHIESDNRDCSTNSLTISENKDLSHPILKSCETSPNVITSSGRMLYVLFETDSFHSKKYFNASYKFQENACGGLIDATNTNILSPNFPSNYPPNVLCEWHIFTEHQHHILLSFIVSDIEMSPNCSSDFVEIYDGESQNDNLLVRHCGTDLPTDLKSTRNHMIVVFKSNNVTERSGWKINIKRSCGTDLMDATTGVLKKEFSDTNCVWTIKSPTPGSHITLTFRHIECSCMAGTSDCEDINGIRIYDGDSRQAPLKKKFCKNHPAPITSNGQSLTILANSGFFDAYYSQYSTSCGGILSSMQGKFSSPNYPNTYPVDVECIWNIQVNEGNFIILLFEELDIIQTDFCNDDYIEVRSENSTGKLLSTLCGNVIPDSLKIYESAWIKFRSNSQIVGKGFLASYNYGHENDLTPEITGNSGRIRPPPLTSIRSDSTPFKWRLFGDEEHVIVLRFLEYSQGLKFFDGFDESAVSTNIEHSPSQKISASNVVLLVSENNILHDFDIRWRSLHKDSDEIEKNSVKCLSIYNVGVNETALNISSPKYPNSYDNDIDCAYILKPENSATHIQLQVFAADLERFPECAADSLKISTSHDLMGWKEEKKVCDLKFNEKPHFTIDGDPNIKIDFHTDSSLQGSGFTSLASSKCGGYMTDSTGLLDSDIIQMQKNDIASINCTWKIEVRPGRKIEFELDFEDSDEDSENVCIQYYILIRDGIDEDAPILKPGRMCSDSDTHNASLITTSNRAYVKFQLARLAKKTTWKLIYKEHIDCGSEVHLTRFFNSTTISTPNFPNIPDPHSECVWTFIGPPGVVIEITFVSYFDYAMSYGKCNNEYIELRDGSTSFSRQIGKFCRKPGVQKTNGNALYLKFMANVAEPKSGFNATVKLSKCGGTYSSPNKGNIQSENYPVPGGYQFNALCEYVIKVPSFYRLNLTIEDLNLPYNSLNENKSDHLDIYSIQNTEDQRSEEKLITLWGNNTLKFLEIDNNEVLIKFFTYDANTLYRGFKINYKQSGARCFKSIESDSGEFKMPKPKSRYQMYILCRWKITVPKGRSVSARITDLSIASSYGYSSNKINFYNDFTASSKIITVSNATYEAINSTDNIMLIRIFSSVKTGFQSLRISFTSYEISPCKNEISDSGKIIAPLNFQNKNYYCTYGFSLNGFETMGIHIKTLLLTSTSTILRLSAAALRIQSEVFWNFYELNRNVTNEAVAVSVKSSDIEILQNDDMKIFALDLEYKKHNCGGQFKASEGFPNTQPFLHDNYGRLDCAWEIKFEGNRDFNLSIVYNLSADCEKEYITIYSGQFPADAEVKKLCGHGDKYNYTVASKFMYIHFHSDQYVDKSTFVIDVVSVSHCGGVINPLYGVSYLHFLPKDYKNNLECVWDFEGKSGYSSAITFQDRFFIQSSENCSKDYLSIKAQTTLNNWYEYPKYCGRNFPSSINTTSQNLRIIFRSDEEGIGDGFTLKITQHCGGIYNVTNKVQKIKSPLNWYYVSCNYTLRTDNNEFINVKFNKFEIDNTYSEECRYARLVVYKPNENLEPDEVGKYCKSNSITEIRSRNFITFIFNANFDRGSFEFDYYSESCGGIITTATQIHSPYDEEGNQYPHGMECIWNITAPADREIIIKFKYVDFERGKECRYDYVSIYEGYQEITNNRKALICGNFTSNAPHIKITGNKALIITRSDEYLSGKGFSAEIGFTKKCDKHIHYVSSNFTFTHYELDYYTPNGYDNYLDCHMLFTIEEGYQLQIEFEDFNVTACDPYKSDCECDYVELFDNSNSVSGSVGKFCGTNIPGVFQSSLQSLMIRFVTDGSGLAGRGFKAAIKHQLSVCGTEFISLSADQSKSLSSPGFGVTAYPANVFCKYVINAENSFKIRFDFFELEDISKKTGKCEDYLQIKQTGAYYYGERENHMFCGNKKPNDIVISKKQFVYENVTVEIVFKSNAAIQKNGFNITLIPITVCNSSYTQSSGTVIIKQRSFRGNKCSIDIAVPEHLTISLFSTPSFERAITDNCTKFLSIFEKKNHELLKKVCAEHGPQQFFLKTNAISIDIDPQSLDLFYIGNTNGAGCGGRTHELKGVLSSPMYPDNIRNVSDCRWDIEVSTNNVVKISFVDFSMGAKINCHSNYVEIIDININGFETVFRKYCGDDDPMSYTSKSYRVAIVYKRTVNFDGKGWLLMYESEIGKKEDGTVIL